MLPLPPPSAAETPPPAGPSVPADCCLPVNMEGLLQGIQQNVQRFTDNLRRAGEHAAEAIDAARAALPQPRAAPLLAVRSWGGEGPSRGAALPQPAPSFHAQARRQTFVATRPHRRRSR